MTAPHYRFERARHKLGARFVAGVDEVGRGPLAGPVGVAAVILSPGVALKGIDDSKKARQGAARGAVPAEFWKVRSRSPSSSPPTRRSTSTTSAAHLARDGARARRPFGPARFRADRWSRHAGSAPCPGEAIIDGDALCLSIAAASIVAKVARDRLMARLDPHFPGYGFSNHAGYGDISASGGLQRLGPTPLHRRSFKSTAPANSNISL